MEKWKIRTAEKRNINIYGWNEIRENEEKRARYVALAAESSGWRHCRAKMHLDIRLVFLRVEMFVENPMNVLIFHFRCNKTISCITTVGASTTEIVYASSRIIVFRLIYHLALMAPNISALLVKCTRFSSSSLKRARGGGGVEGAQRCAGTKLLNLLTF